VSMVERAGSIVGLFGPLAVLLESLGCGAKGIFVTVCVLLVVCSVVPVVCWPGIVVVVAPKYVLVFVVLFTSITSLIIIIIIIIISDNISIFTAEA